jgi:uncharacterized membrane protein
MTDPNEPNERDPISPVTPPPPADVPPAIVPPVDDPPPPPVDPPPPPAEPPPAPAEPPPPEEPARPGDPQPDRPSSTDWREPPWFPPRDKDRRDRKSSLASIVIGLIILAIGVYWLLDRTLGVPMPRIQWGSLWPILLIVVGGLVLLRSIQRR